MINNSDILLRELQKITICFRPIYNLPKIQELSKLQAFSLWDAIPPEMCTFFISPRKVLMLYLPFLEMYLNLDKSCKCYDKFSRLDIIVVVSVPAAWPTNYRADGFTWCNIPCRLWCQNWVGDGFLHCLLFPRLSFFCSTKWLLSHQDTYVWKVEQLMQLMFWRK